MDSGEVRQFRVSARLLGENSEPYTWPQAIGPLGPLQATRLRSFPTKGWGMPVRRPILSAAWAHPWRTPVLTAGAGSGQWAE